MAYAFCREHDSGLRILLDGAVKIHDAGFTISADFNVYYQALRLSFAEFPSLRRLITLAGLQSLEAYFPEPLASLLDIQLAQLGMVLHLHDKSVSEVRFGLTTTKAIELIPGIIAVTPSLDMQVYAPFDERFREIEGTLRGIWQLGSTAFETTLSYPSYSFYAGMVEGQSLDMNAVLDRILPGISLPISIQLTQMKVWGNFFAGSFAAEIAVSGDSTWGFELGGRAFALQSISMGMAYENQQVVSCTMDGTLILSDVQVFISAQYDTAQGWMLMGGTAIEDTINLTSILHDLLEAISLPDNLPDLKLKNLVFFAAPKTGEYSLSGQTAEDWQLTDKLSLQVEEFAATKSQNGPVSGTLRAIMTIDQTIVRLSAEKAASTDGGWQFRGSTGPGQKIPIGKLIERLANLFGEVTLPSPIAAFTIEDLEVAFNTHSKDFTFTCTGQLQGKFEAQVTIDIARQSDGSYRKTFGGQLIIYPAEAQPLYFTLTFDTEPTAQTLLATYHEPGGRQVSIDQLLSQVFSADVTTGVQLTLKDALFAYRGDTEGAKYLFGLDIGLDIGLAQLPVVGPALPAELQVGVENLQILAATRAFSLTEVNALNRLLPANVTRLPSGKAESESLHQGLNVAAQLKLGGADQLLMLPASETSAPPDSRTPTSPTSGATPTRTAKATPAAGIAKWFNVQKSLGPLRLNRLGVEWRDQRLGFLFDAGMDLLGVRLDLLGLRVSVPLANPRLEDVAFGLDGLELAVKQPPLEISGALLKAFPTDPDVSLQYDGRVLVRAEVFTLAALGSYAVVKGEPSLFIFAVLHRELGGPSFFFVTGLAFGFGVNRLLKLPDIAEIHNFPLIKAATDPEYIGGNATPRTAMEKLQEYIPPSRGDYWLAAGVKFNSFGMIDSFAMLSVSFGTQLQIAILGLSRLTVPRQLPGMPPVDPVACAELAIKVTFTPASGLLAAEARLTDNSFLFSKECKLTGGFALYCWFGPEHAGDFVVTLGGYHPKFIPPSHYPVVPRLGMTWPVSANLALSGQLYFALTPSCLMAGGALSAVYQAGDLRAWFYANADFLMNWQPFSYDVEMAVRLGASYRLSILGITRTLSIELGAWMHMWGPPFGGIARVTWTIVSFDIAFGAAQQPVLEKVTWDAFQRSFLPQAEEASADPLVSTIRITSGLIKEHEVTQDGKKSTLRVVNAHELSFSTESVLPATSVLLNNQAVAAADSVPRPLGIRPMDITDLTSVHAVTFAPRDPSQNGWAAYVTPTLITRNVPDALWSDAGLSRLQRPSAEMIEAVPNGVRVALRHREPSHGLAPIALEKFQYERLPPKNIDWQAWQPPATIPAPGNNTLMNTIWGNSTVQATRQAILSALGKEKAEVKLEHLAAHATEILQSEPEMARLGEPLTQQLYFN